LASSAISAGHFSAWDTVTILIAYNAIAFGLQPIFGYAADRT
jgi:hypothetical protein